MWLFRALAREELGRGLGEDEADGEVGVMRERGEDIGNFDRGYGSAGCQQEMVFPIGGVRSCGKRRSGAAYVVFWGYYLQHFYKVSNICYR